MAARVGVDRNALERLIWNESRGNPAIGMDKSNYSAGIGQVSRLIWRTYSKLPYTDAVKPEKFEENISVAAQYLKHNYKHYGSWRLALAGYNEGETVLNKVLRHERDLSPITKKYIEGMNY